MEADIQQWKMKHFIKQLRDIHSNNATGLISLIMPPKTQISIIQSLLADEYGASSNIKSHVNKLAVLSAITAVQQRLKLYNNIPPNGLIIYCGNALIDGKEKKIIYAIEPPLPINRQLYRCDNVFHVDVLEEVIQDHKSYGFIIMDGQGVLFARIQGNVKKILTKYGVDLPKKQRKGGQSSQRFQRIRLEKIDAYIKKTCELTTQVFITNNLPNVSGLFLAGLAEFKNHLSVSPLFDPRLKPLIIKVLDISYGGEMGLNQAIDVAKNDLSNLPLIKEKEVINKFFEHLKNDTGLCIYGIKETLQAIEASVVDVLILNEGFNYKYKPSTEASESELIKNDCSSDDPLFTEWVAENYQKLGCQVYYVTTNTGEGMQFWKGFSGIGGILRYQWKPDPPSTSSDINGTIDKDVNVNDVKDVNDFDESDFFM